MHHQIDEITKGIPKVIKKNLCMLSEDNIKTVIRYITTTNTDINLSSNYRKDIIELLTRLARYYADKIAANKDFKFKDVTRDDIIRFLDSHRKLKEEDPLNRWVGTYNTYLIHITRFFKWLYAPDTPAKERKKPAVVDNIPKLHRKQQSIYKPSDMWTPEDDLLFLSYCPSKRDRCYHAISRDLSARPHEILSLRITP